MALIDHVIVLDHLQPQVIAGPPTQSYEDALRRLGVPESAIQVLPEAHRQQRVGAEGEAKVSASALDLRPSGLVAEVDWPCGCGRPLHGHHDFVLGAWARHVAVAEGIDTDHLERHAVQAIRAEHDFPVVFCSCGARFAADGYLPDPALRAWAAHVGQAQ